MSRAHDIANDGDDRGRRWHDFRPQSRRRTDLMGFNSTLWMGLGWVISVLALVFPLPWWR
jgi:hypothetical protein